jgi:hypothetical protein
MDFRLRTKTDRLGNRLEGAEATEPSDGGPVFSG